MLLKLKQLSVPPGSKLLLTDVKWEEALGVPELWRFEKGELKIYLLEDGKYVESDKSKNCPNLPLKEAIPEYLERGSTMGK